MLQLGLAMVFRLGWLAILCNLYAVLLSRARNCVNIHHWLEFLALFSCAGRLSIRSFVFYRSFAIHVVARMTYVVERALEQGSVSSYNGMESMFASSKLLMIDVLFNIYRDGREREDTTRLEG